MRALPRGIFSCTGALWVALLVLLAPIHAAENSTGCDKFAWPLKRESAWFAASDKTNVASGETLVALPKSAFIMRLKPGSEASFAMPPERVPRSAGPYGGTVSFAAPERPGIYQVTLSDDAWVDIVQDGRYARSVGSSGRSDCPGLRKSVRLELGPTLFVLQISGVIADSIVVAVGAGE